MKAGKNSISTLCFGIATFASLLSLGSIAHSNEIKDCAQSGIGINTLVAPVAENNRSFYNGKVNIYKVDTIEPACCSAGLAIVLPDVASEIGDTKCVSITGLGGVDVKNATSTYNPSTGLTVILPTSAYDPETGRQNPSKALSLKINLKDSSVQVEK